MNKKISIPEIGIAEVSEYIPSEEIEAQIISFEKQAEEEIVAKKQTEEKTFSQPFGKKIVSLKFLDKARDYALRLSNVNDDVKKTMSTVTTISDEPKKKGIFSLLKTINWG